MSSNGMNALTFHPSKMTGKCNESDDSSYEDESISDDSYFSYYSIDQLSVIVEETEQDILDELEREGSISCRGSLSKLRLVEDIPPSPPVRRWSECDDELLLKISTTSTSPNSSRSGTRSTHTSSTASTSLSSDSILPTNQLLPPLTSPSHLRRDCRSLDDDDEESSSSTCSSAPLDPEDSPASRGEQRYGLRDHVETNRLLLQDGSLVSFHLGEGVFLSQSDDEYTFVSCTTGDDMSLVSELGSSYHNRAGLSIDGIDDEFMEQASEHQRTTSKLSNSGLSSRRGSGFSTGDGDLLLTIPEGDSSDDDNAVVFKQPINYKMVQKQLDCQINSLTRALKDDVLSEHDATSYRLNALKHRLQLERYSGVRRRRTFERAKKMLGKKIVGVRKIHQSYHALHRSEAESQPMQDTLARFGGLTRRESFKVNKSTFEKKFVKEMKPMTKNLRRQRSLSPVRPESSSLGDFERSDFILRMSKSEGNLSFNINDVFEEPEIDKTHGKLDGDHDLDQSFKLRQERYGGLQRRNRFNRSRRFLSRKLDKIQARSQEEKERFGGLQRMASYKQSRHLFQDPVSRNRKSMPSFERVEGDRVCKIFTNLEWDKACLNDLREDLPKPLHKFDTVPSFGRSRKHLQHAFKNSPQSCRE